MSSNLPKTLPRYLTIDKKVGETPLMAAERLRASASIPAHIPLAYAGRLDPMASGKLLILIGDECKVQEKYHVFDKEYEVQILFGVRSDTGDVLGLTQVGSNIKTNEEAVRSVIKKMHGDITLPYPHFSSKTVKGKPLHVWTLEKRLGEIDIPVKKSRIHKITFTGLKTISREEVLKTVRAKIETIPEVTDPKKALGADFRRDSVRDTWNRFEKDAPSTLQIASFTCIASSGTYMRSLSELIAENLHTYGLAYNIHRTRIGTYVSFGRTFGLWVRQF